MLRKGRLARLSRLGGMAVGFVGDAAGAGTRLATATTEAAATEFHQRAAKRMLEVFGDMKGLPLKAGQMLSYIDEILPPEHRHIYNEMLGKLRRHTPPMEWIHICEVFTEEFDGREPDEVFGRFDPEPIAAASIGQVYRGALPDGTEVAIKVQYPGVAEAIRSDLDNAETLVGAMSAVMPKADLLHFMQDIYGRVEEECDYTLELRNQRDFRALWADDATVVIPRAYDEFSTRRVLTSEFLDGHEYPHVVENAPGERKSLYGRKIFRFVFRSLYGFGMFNADPHPGNYLFWDDGRVAFIDYGCVQRYSPERAALLRDLRDAVLTGMEGPPFQDLLLKVFGVPERIDDEVMELFEQYMHLSMQPITAPQPYRFTREYCQQLLKLGMEAKLVLTRKMFTRANVNIFDVEDTGMAFLGRINFGLGSILATLGAEGDFRALMNEIDA